MAVQRIMHLGMMGNLQIQHKSRIIKGCDVAGHAITCLEKGEGTPIKLSLSFFFFLFIILILFFLNHDML
uniref:Uncharacterized protein n=1 Tax=Nelumbo nucifera TaxID=4432 RepID=A0A822ZQB2_NELNU|nr:TPA_asm: hypothetical protein HUJ06_017014 [Nelumbo nucifera]